MTNFILYLLFKIFTIKVLILPEKLRYYLGIIFAKFAYLLTPKRRETVSKNLKKAFNDEYSEDELKEMTKKVYNNAGLILVEFVLEQKLTEDNFKDFIEIEGENNLKQAYNSGNGVIIYGAHFSNWELMAAAISLLGYPLNAIARSQNNSFFNEEINKIRDKVGINVIPKGMSVRNVYKHLKKGELIYILGDQDARSRGWKMNFFGRDSSTFPGVVQFSKRTGAKIVPTFLVRTGWRKYKLKFYSPVQVNSNANKEEQKKILQDLVDLTEEEIRKNPSQWFWLHRRWKTFHQGE